MRSSWPSWSWCHQSFGRQARGRDWEITTNASGKVLRSGECKGVSCHGNPALGRVVEFDLEPSFVRILTSENYLREEQVLC